jgi:hypothetical protein
MVDYTTPLPWESLHKSSKDRFKLAALLGKEEIKKRRGERQGKTATL